MIALFVDLPEDQDVYAPITTRMVQLLTIDARSAAAVVRGPALAKRLKRAKQVNADRKIEEN